MRRLAVTVSAIGFFAMAIVGWASDLPPFVCAYRSLIGAAALYVTTTIACRLAIAIMVHAVVKNTSAEKKPGTNRDNRNQ